MLQVQATRIIVEQQPGRDDWQAWFSDAPHSSFVGDNTRLAIKNLLDHHPERIPSRYRLRVDRQRYQRGHFELLISSARGCTSTCPECRGTGRYIGLTVIEPCSACGGTGVLG